MAVANRQVHVLGFLVIFERNLSMESEFFRENTIVLIGLIFLIVAAVAVASGQTSLKLRSIKRATEPLLFWLTVAMHMGAGLVLMAVRLLAAR